MNAHTHTHFYVYTNSNSNENECYFVCCCCEHCIHLLIQTYFCISFARADASIFLHVDPRSNAFFAARTARSISALSASAISASGLPVCGFNVANFLPDCASTNSLLIKSYQINKQIYDQNHYNKMRCVLCSFNYLCINDWLIWIGHILVCFLFLFAVNLST